MRLAIDFDGTLHDVAHPPEGRKMGPPLPGAVQAMRELYPYHTLIVHTVRKDPIHVERWLRYFDIPFHSVTHEKPNADLYIDDRAYRHVDWPSTLDAIERTGNGEEADEDHRGSGRGVRQDRGEEEARQEGGEEAQVVA